MKQKKNELKKLYQEIKQTTTTMGLYSEHIPFEKIIEGFKDIEDEDCPDGIMLIDDTVYILEHFMVSIYRKKSGEDTRQRALTGKNDRYFKSCPNETTLTVELKGSLKNLQHAIEQSLSKHMESYPLYLKEAEKKHPGIPHKLIFVVEDQSESIIEGLSIGLLGIYELVDAFLKYNSIDAVICYNTSTRGNSILALDRKRMTDELENSVKIDNCTLSALIDKVFIQKLNDSKWVNDSEWVRIKNYLMKCREGFGLVESITIEKNGG